MNDTMTARRALDARKFRDPERTADGAQRAAVSFSGLTTLWFNTGTLCNITCAHCYIESSPTNDRLAYLRLAEVETYLDEIARDGLPTREIGLTGGEPFMNPDIVDIVGSCLRRGFRVLVLTNATRPMARHREALAALNRAWPGRLTLRVSLDHYTASRHDAERGAGSFDKAVQGMMWLAANGFAPHVAARNQGDEDETTLRAGFARLFARLGMAIDATDAARLVVFPEMDATLDVPEITTACWDMLAVRPEAMMCATSRMVVKRKGADRPAVVACTLVPYEPGFELGHSLAEAARPVALNHPHCARFCVLGGASCSAG